MPTDSRIEVHARTTEQEVAGLDALELADAAGKGPSRVARAWTVVWPKLAAIGIVLAVWQAVAWSGFRPDYLLPGPGPVLGELVRAAGTGNFWEAVATTMRRALVGFAIATVIGLALGIVVARVKLLRSAIGSLITGLQTMPSIAWFPLAILLFQLSETAILFVVVLGAAPSIANGVITGVDYIQPVMLRAAQNMGATGWQLYRHVVLPASLPSIVAGLKLGWAFAWRSLMAGELLVIIAATSSIGVRLSFAREFADAQGLMATMLVILIIGIVVDVAFNAVNNTIRRRWGVAEVTT